VSEIDQDFTAHINSHCHMYYAKGSCAHHPCCMFNHHHFSEW